jgi:hypothetical protein
MLLWPRRVRSSGYLLGELVGQTTLSHAEPEEANDAFVFLLAGERAVLPAMPPLRQLLRLEITQEANLFLLAKGQELLFEGRREFPDGVVDQTTGAGIGEVGVDRILDRRKGHGCFHVLAAGSCDLVLPGDPFSLLPGGGLRRGAKTALATREAADQPLHAGAAFAGGVVLIFTGGCGGGHRRKASCHQFKTDGTNLPQVFDLTCFYDAKLLILFYLEMVEAVGVEPVCRIENT